MNMVKVDKPCLIHLSKPKRTERCTQARRVAVTGNVTSVRERCHFSHAAIIADGSIIFRVKRSGRRVNDSFNGRGANVKLRFADFKSPTGPFLFARCWVWNNAINYLGPHWIDSSGEKCLKVASRVQRSRAEQDDKHGLGRCFNTVSERSRNPVSRTIWNPPRDRTTAAADRPSGPSIMLRDTPSSSEQPTRAGLRRTRWTWERKACGTEWTLQYSLKLPEHPSATKDMLMNESLPPLPYMFAIHRKHASVYRIACN